MCDVAGDVLRAWILCLTRTNGADHGLAWTDEFGVRYAQDSGSRRARGQLTTHGIVTGIGAQGPTSHGGLEMRRVSGDDVGKYSEKPYITGVSLEL